MSRTISPLDSIRPGAPWRRRFTAAVLGLAFWVSTTGCSRDPGDLRVDQLNAEERQFVERFIVLERARAVVLADPAHGSSILDSLASAWGDTAAQVAINALPPDPRRTARLLELVARLLEAESDSLIHIPSSRRLSAPLPQPRTTTP